MLKQAIITLSIILFITLGAINLCADNQQDRIYIPSYPELARVTLDKWNTDYVPHYGFANLSAKLPEYRVYLNLYSLDPPVLEIIEESWNISDDGKTYIDQYIIKDYNSNGYVDELTQHKIILDTATSEVLDYETIPYEGDLQAYNKHYPMIKFVVDSVMGYLV